ncbi:peptidase S10 serine carboxypeptidase [Phanerochaete sordida]|uniref:carboxypeptidase C n=1 Tax=Phanerochaete sordida TaxID=48140 RepID=A0A9P3G050_9APHY|nr:peptidase S10 serine carboxypeptidase [Phanerochaete sordida]
MLRAIVGLLVSSFLLPGVHGRPQAQEPSQVALGSNAVGEWLSSTIYAEDGVHFERVQHSHFPKHQLRITRPKLCDKQVEQYSGYLDVADDKHLFFWFFEARHDPENAPLMLWLNGGPGVSTIASGLLFENGPCIFNTTSWRIEDRPLGWNEKVNIVYLDQPAGTGYSYGAGTTTTLPGVAADADAFLQLFLQRFPRYARLPLHIAGESFGGHFVPHIGAFVAAQNAGTSTGRIPVRLASLVLANGLSEPASQFATSADYLCGGGPYPPFAHDDRRCVAWRAATPPCVRMIETCYAYENNATCGAATAYCWPAVFTSPVEAVHAAGKNIHDLRAECEESAIPGNCYPQFDAISEWLNQTSTKRRLGVDQALDFQFMKSDIQQPFFTNGQAVLNSAALLVPLVNSGIRLLAFAGDADGVCNYMGIELWMRRLEHKHHAELAAVPPQPWVTSTGYHAGEVTAAGKGAVAFVRVFEAGHMAPYDQPEATLELISKWVDGEEL